MSQWTLTVGGADVTSATRPGAFFREVASSVSGGATFTLVGNPPAVVTGASVLLARGATTLWEGTVSNVQTQTDSISGSVTALLVSAAPLSAALNIATAYGATTPVDASVIAASICGTVVPFGGPSPVGIDVGSLSISNVASGLKALAYIIGGTWRVQNGSVQFITGASGITTIPVALSTTNIAGSSVSVTGGADATTRLPLAASATTVGNPPGPAYQAVFPEIADSLTLDLVADALAEAYGQGAVSAKATLPVGTTLRAGDWALDSNGVTAPAWDVSYTLFQGDLQATVVFGYPVLPTDPQYAVSVADAAARNPVFRAHGDYITQGATLTTNGTSGTLTAASITLADVNYQVSAGSITLPQNGVVLVEAKPSGYSVVTNLVAPKPGAAVLLYRVTMLNGIVQEVADFRTRGGVGVTNVKFGNYPAPTFGSTPTAASVNSVAGLTAEVTVTVPFNNIPADNTAVRILWYFRTTGSSNWTAWAESTIPGLPNPSATQTLNFTYGGLTNGGVYDFGVAYVGIREDIGPISVTVSGFTAQVLAIPGTYFLGSGSPAPAPVISGTPTITPSGIVSGATSAVALSFAVSNQPTDGSLQRIGLWIRKTGATAWTPNGQIAPTAPVAGVASYSGTQTDITNGSGYDFGCSYVGIAGSESPVTTIGSITSQALALKTSYLTGGSGAAPTLSVAAAYSETASVSGLTTDLTVTFTTNNQPTDGSLSGLAMFLATSGGSAGLYAVLPIVGTTGGAYSFTFTGLSNGTSYVASIAYVYTNQTYGSSLSLGSHTETAVSITIPYLIAGAAWTPTLAVSPTVTPAVSTTGVSASVTVGFTITNQPTDGSFSRVSLWYRKTGTTAWSFYASLPAVGVGQTNPPASGAYSFIYADLTNGVGYDFGVSGENAQGGETSVVTIGSSSSQSMGIPSGYLLGGSPWTPALAASPTISSSTSQNGIAADISVSCTVTNQPTDGSLSRMSFWYRRNGQTTWTFYASVPAVGVGSLTPPASGAYSFVFADLTNSIAYDLGISGENAQGADTGVTLIGTSTAVTASIPGPSLTGIPAGMTFSSSGSVSSYSAPNGGACSAVLSLTLAILTNGGTVANWLSSIQVLTAPTGTTNWTVNTDIPTNALGTFTPTVVLGAGQAYDVAVRLISNNPSSVSAIQSAGFTTTAQTIGTQSMQKMPSAIKTNGPTISGVTVPTLSRTLTSGSQATFTLGVTVTDFGPQPAWFERMEVLFRLGTTTYSDDARPIAPPQITFGASTASPTNNIVFSLPIGQTVEFGLRYVDASGDASKTVWPSQWGGTAGSDPAGALIDTGDAGKGIVHTRNSGSVKTLVNASGQLLATEFSGGTQNTDGTFTNVHNASSTTTVKTSSGNIVSVEAMISKDATTWSAGVVIGSRTTNGYYLYMDASGNIYVDRMVSGVGTHIIGPLALPTGNDTGLHSYTLVVKFGTSNTVEAVVDATNLGPYTDASPPAIANPTSMQLDTGTSAGKLQDFQVRVGAAPFSNQPPGVTTILTPQGGHLAVDFFNSFENPQNPTTGYPGYVIVGSPTTQGICWAKTQESANLANGTATASITGYQFSSSGAFGVYILATGGGAGTSAGTYPTTGYLAEVFNSGLRIYKFTSGSGTQLGTAQACADAKVAAAHNLKLTAYLLPGSQGVLLVATFDGAQLAVMDTSSYYTTGTWGVDNSNGVVALSDHWYSNSILDSDSTISARPRRNEIVNGNCSNGQGDVAPLNLGWGGYYGSGSSFVVGGTYNGQSAMTFSKGTSAGGVYQDIPTVVGRTYTMHAILQHSAAGIQPLIFLGNTAYSVTDNTTPGMPIGAIGQFYSAASLSYHLGVNGSGAYPANQWNYIAHTFVAQRSLTRLLIYGNDTVAGSIYMAGLMLHEGNRLQEYVDHEPNAGAVHLDKHVKDGSTYNKIKASEVTTGFVKQINDGTNTRTVANVAAIIGSDNKVPTSTPFDKNLINQMPNVTVDAAVQISSTTTTAKVWLTNAAGTGPPSWKLPDGTILAPTSAQAGSSTSPLINQTGLSSSNTYYYIITLDPVSLNFTSMWYGTTPPTRDQINAASGDGSILAVQASAATSQGIVPGTTNGSYHPGGSGRTIN